MYLVLGLYFKCTLYYLYYLTNTTVDMKTYSTALHKNLICCRSNFQIDNGQLQPYKLFLLYCVIVIQYSLK